MKKLAKLLVAFAMTASVAACSGNTGTTDEATTITIWHTFTQMKRQPSQSGTLSLKIMKPCWNRLPMILKVRMKTLL